MDAKSKELNWTISPRNFGSAFMPCVSFPKLVRGMTGMTRQTGLRSQKDTMICPEQGKRRLGKVLQ